MKRSSAALGLLATAGAVALLSGGLALPAHADDPVRDIRLVDATDSFVVTGNYIAWEMGPTNDGQVATSGPVGFSLDYDEPVQPATPNAAHAYSDVHFTGRYAHDCTVSTKTFRAVCTLPALQPGATEMVTLLAKADLSGIGQAVTGFEASVGGPDADSNPANNSESGADVTDPKPAPLSPSLMADPGELHGGGEIYSANAQYRLDMQSDGNLVEYGDGRALWSSGTAGNPAAYFVIEMDGTGKVFGPDGTVLWTSPTPHVPLIPYPYAGLTNDGAFWIYQPPSESYTGSPPMITLWQTDASGTNSATAPSVFTAGQYLHDGSARLVMQTDGNLVDYLGTKALWASNTNGYKGNTFRVQTDGNLVVYTAGGKALWSSHTGRVGSSVRLSLAASGLLTLTKGATLEWHAG